MTEIKLCLDLNAEADNLYIETGNSDKAMYQIFGFGPLEEEGRVTDTPQRITLEAGEKNVLDSISEADSDYLLAANVTTFEADEVCIYEFENKKLNVLEKVGEDLFEIPLKEQTSIENASVADILATEFYSLEYDDTRDDFPLSTNRLLVFLFGEKERIYRSHILDSADDDAFIEEANQFMEDYDIEFEHTEEKELVLSTIYLMREYLNQDWEEIYELLKRG